MEAPQFAGAQVSYNFLMPTVHADKTHMNEHRAMGQVFLGKSNGTSLKSCFYVLLMVYGAMEEFIFLHKMATNARIVTEER